MSPCQKLISYFWPFSCSQLAPTITNTTKVNQWLQRYQSDLSSFNRVATKGLYSVLDKEVQKITLLVKDGQEISKSAADCAATSQMINTLIKPKLDVLEHACKEARKKLADNPKLIQEDAKLSSKWGKLGLPTSVLEHHADCARFLVDSSLIFSILGYQETCKDANRHSLKLDFDGHPMIKTQGHFKRWEVLARELEYDPKIDKIKSRAYSGNIAQTWNYFDPQGLVPIDRFNYDRVYPIYELPQSEYNRLLAHSKKFYEDNTERDPGVNKNCVVQFFTSSRRQGIPNYSLLTNLHKNAPVHIAMRLITADKKVYSFGYQMPFEEQEFVLSSLFSTFLATAEAKVSMLDYEEFRNHEGRLVTSIPLSSPRSENILSFLNDLNQKQLRFQFSRQNCSSLMQEVIQRAGYDVEIRTTGAATLWDMLPYPNQLPLIGKLIGKVESCVCAIWAALPNWITHPIKWCRDVVFYIPDKIATIMVNLFIWKLGAAKKTTPLREGIEEDELYNKKGILNFSSVIRSWGDLFKDETGAVNHSKYFVEWQNRQKSTFEEPPAARPRLAMVPPDAPAQSIPRGA